ncbi:hypothetical protein EVAR_4723_1 [Eumeta japonica]|uniref:Uncharacterized protein n=1 Tax=Eumeta variegata TaxID=151549 RepID=A0A4C1T1G1_EUMVA|nr:hypothetical protein EVAR_4723_1 [Eumeta japonica]
MSESHAGALSGIGRRAADGRAPANRIGSYRYPARRLRYNKSHDKVEKQYKLRKQYPPVRAPPERKCREALRFFG